MKRLSAWSAALILFGTIALNACGANNSPIASGAGPAARIAGDAVIKNAGGQYSGTIADNRNGKGTATAALSQYENGVGGSFVYTYGTQSFLSNTAGLLDSSGAITGTSVSTVLSTACSYSFTAKYDSSKHTLDGTYKAVNGCTGESGTLKLKEQCYYVQEWAVRPNNGLGRC